MDPIWFGSGRPGEWIPAPGPRHAPVCGSTPPRRAEQTQGRGEDATGRWVESRGQGMKGGRGPRGGPGESEKENPARPGHCDGRHGRSPRWRRGEELGSRAALWPHSPPARAHQLLPTGDQAGRVYCTLGSPPGPSELPARRHCRQSPNHGRRLGSIRFQVETSGLFKSRTRCRQESPTQAPRHTSEEASLAAHADPVQKEAAATMVETAAMQQHRVLLLRR